MGRTSLSLYLPSQSYITMHRRQLIWLLALCALMCAVHSMDSLNTEDGNAKKNGMSLKLDLASNAVANSKTDTGVALVSKLAQATAAVEWQAAYRRRRRCRRGRCRGRRYRRRRDRRRRYYQRRRGRRRGRSRGRQYRLRRYYQRRRRGLSLASSSDSDSTIFRRRRRRR